MRLISTTKARHSKDAPLAIYCRQRRKTHREHLHVLPEILSRHSGVFADVRSPAVRQMLNGVREERGVPQPEDDARREDGLPARLGGDDRVHERKETRRGIGGFDVDVELDVVVLGLLVG